MPIERNGQTIFLISNENIGFFKAKFEKIVKRANRIGMVPIPSYQFLKEVKKTIGRDEITGLEIIRLYTEISVAGEAPIIDGWKLVGAIDHLPEGNMVAKLRQDVDISKYITAEPACDHCGIQRKRNKTFILKDTQASFGFMQVGSTCLHDFLGHNSPENIASIAELIADLHSACGSMEGDDFFGGGSVNYVYNLEYYLGIVNKVIRENGWLPRSKAEVVGKTPTSEIAWGGMISKESKYRIEPEDSDREHAKMAIVWVSDLPDDLCLANEYLNNIRLVARRGVAEGKFAGYAASIIPTYDREMAKQAELATNQANSQHYGNVGDKVELTVTMFSSKSMPSQFGATVLSLFKDAQGNIFKWFGSGFDEQYFKVGETKTIWGTIKGHDEYKGVKQTTLTRCTMKQPAWAKKKKG